MRKTLLVLGLSLVIAGAYLGVAWSGFFGKRESPGRITAVARPQDSVAANVARERAAADRLAGGTVDKQILFGDLHVHTTYSLDAFLHSLPLMQGEGTHPPADACDFARFCSSLDFFSINDHAESLDARRWQETKESIRQCNSVSGDAANPDLVAFVGWEWTQMGITPATHYGHKNVLFRDLGDDEVPTRPIAASGVGFDAMRARGAEAGVLAMAALDPLNRQRYFDLQELRSTVRAAPLCADDVNVRDLPPDCAEAVATPSELFAKLDQWGFDSLVIPHGNAWGSTSPQGISWDNQLADGNHDPAKQRLIEVFSGHGNSEEYRPWRHVRLVDGKRRCPPPSTGFVPPCWRAGQIIAERCRAAGEADAECDRRAETARRNYLDALHVGRFTVPAHTPADWRDAGQCTDCFLPAFDYRPGGSAQYALATGSATPGGGDRFRFGFIASSDTHFARAGTGYKEIAAHGMTDLWSHDAQWLRRFIEPHEDAPRPNSMKVDPAKVMILPGGDTERAASFYYTGGLVAVHAPGRDRNAIWDALQRREVYATSGPRILLWFGLIDGAGRDLLPMGGETARTDVPRFRVRAIGSFAQKPGCPQETLTAMSAERLEALCKGECYHPSDTRIPINRIEVVRIRPRTGAEEDVAPLIEDPWRSFLCDGSEAGCVVEFADEEFAAGGRDAVYYVRAIQAPTPHINGNGLNCVYDADGECSRLRPCPGEEGNDCLGDAEARAWSSPIFVDFGAPAAEPTP